jgi:hypothetical protein
MSWDDITLGQYLELYDVLRSEDPDEFTIMSILFDKAYDDIYNMSVEEYKVLETQIDFIKKPVTTKYKTELLLNNTVFKLLDFNKLEFGAFIDIEHLLMGEKDYSGKLSIIFSIMYRRVIQEGSDFEAEVLEPYGNWNRTDLIDNVPVTSVWGLPQAYMAFRSKLFESFSGLFQEEEPEEEDEDLTGLTSTERNAIANDQKLKKWGWELMLFKLANRDPLKMADATKISIIQALNTLGMMQECKIQD